MVAPSTPPRPAAAAPWWKRWWRRLPPSRQDRFATLGPLLAVLLFLSAIVVAIAYLRFEEIDREREAVTRDVEYAQQRLRLVLDDPRADTLSDADLGWALQRQTDRAAALYHGLYGHSGAVMAESYRRMTLFPFETLPG